MEYAKFKRLDFTHLNMGPCNTMAEQFEVHLKGHEMHKEVITRTTITHKQKVSSRYDKLTNDVEVFFNYKGKEWKEHDDMLKELNLPIRPKA